MRYISVRTHLISIHGTVISLETTSLEPSEGYLTNFGCLSGETAIVGQIEQPDESPVLLEQARDALVAGRYCTPGANLALQRPYITHYSHFIEEWLGVSMDHDVLSKWRSLSDRQDLKAPRLREFVSTPHDYFRPFYFQLAQFTQRRADRLWDAYIEVSDPSNKDILLTTIMCYNLFDLLAAASLLLWENTTFASSNSLTP